MKILIGCDVDPVLPPRSATRPATIFGSVWTIWNSCLIGQKENCHPSHGSFAPMKVFDFQPATLHPATRQDDRCGKRWPHTGTSSAGTCILCRSTHIQDVSSLILTRIGLRMRAARCQLTT